MPINRDPGSIVDIFLACEDIVSFTQGMNRHDFAIDDKTQAAVLYKLAIIGEAVRRLSKEFTAAHPKMPWSRIIDTRNLLTHEYDRVEVQRIWDIIRVHVPELRDYVRPLLPDEHE